MGMALGEQKLFSGLDAERDTRWEPSKPHCSATLWRYMSFAKFCSLLERKALFFSLVSEMADKYEGFVYPPTPHASEDRLQQAERIGHRYLSSMTRTALISCWTKANHESNLMWDAYTDTEGIAIRTTFHDLQNSIRSVHPTYKLPTTFGQVEYVDYRQQTVPRFGWAPLFHKRIEYRDEEEVRIVLPGPPLSNDNPPEIILDPDVERQRGRYITVDLNILLKEIVISPRTAQWFTQVVESVVRRSQIQTPINPSTLTLPLH